MTSGPTAPFPLPSWPQLQQAWAAGRIVSLAVPQEQGELAAALGPQPAAALAALQQRWGAGVLVGSGGSSGRRRWCLQPLTHLQASASATALWLQQQGLDPATCLHLNPLPLHHVSGLMPLLRAHAWGCDQRLLAPELLRDPAALAAALPLTADRPVLLSLVPTQLQRLMAGPEGLAWLRQLAVIWVGGAPLPPALAARARQKRLRLAPCYGATETAAMVCAQPPQRFLAGAAGCGPPLADVQLRLEPGSGAVTLQTARLSPGWLEDGRLQPLDRSADGWWRSGDAGRLTPDGLAILGRLDGAIHSGGETVFPEQLEQRLRQQAAAAGLPLQQVLLLPAADAEWGQRLVALLRPEAGADGQALIAALQPLVRAWPPAARPRCWQLCPELAPTALGKWQRDRWQRWWLALEAGHSSGGDPHDGDSLRH